MRIAEIKKHITAEDRMITAVNCECHPNMVHAVFRAAERIEKGKKIKPNDRNPDTKLGKAIIAELTRLAQINIDSLAKKKAA